MPRRTRSARPTLALRLDHAPSGLLSRAQVFGSLALTLWLLAGGVYSHAVNHAAGYVGAFCGLSAIYTAFAEIYLETLGVRAPGLAPVKLI